MRGTKLRFWYRAHVSHKSQQPRDTVEVPSLSDSGNELRTMNTPFQDWSSLVREALDCKGLDILVRAGDLSARPKSEGWVSTNLSASYATISIYVRFIQIPFPTRAPKRVEKSGPVRPSARSPNIPYAASSTTSVSTGLSHFGASSSSLATTVYASEAPPAVSADPNHPQSMAGINQVIPTKPRRPPLPRLSVPSVANPEIGQARLTSQASETGPTEDQKQDANLLSRSPDGATSRAKPGHSPHVQPPGLSSRVPSSTSASPGVVTTPKTTPTRLSASPRSPMPSTSERRRSWFQKYIWNYELPIVGNTFPPPPPLS
ncbi:hypothetical protein BC834DRAFT_301251 [Gloeopeniophorella convolvens]|nr:hypothetical protein BC834DRAFT_301251 [Gloeopeniophorella convolvens]